MMIDPEKTAALIAEIAQEEIVPRYGRLADSEIDTKTSPSDFVTEADLATEKKLKKALCGLYPGATFIGEETVAANPDLLPKLGDEGAFWIVDPLDGTRNFVQGRPEFGTIVALVVNGETRIGWIYAIPDNAFAIGELGSGVSWRGKQLKTLSPSEDPLKGYRAIGNIIEPWKSRIVPKLRSGFETEAVTCSAYGYIHLITGDRDFALYSRTHPWDHAAGVLMVSEIGGRAEYLDTGEAYAPRPAIGRPLLVSGSQESWEAVSGVLMGAGNA
jgi:fructose-1,6-bisphosphatase/inositol monophosphatase family enzyme